MVQREIGRRVWWALAAQDWLCSTSLGMYTIQRKHFSAAQPGYYDEETFSPVPDDGTPTFPHVGNYLSEVAYLLINYHDDMLDASDIETKYNVVSPMIDTLLLSVMNTNIKAGFEIRR